VDPSRPRWERVQPSGSTEAGLRELIGVYDKGEQADLNADQKKVLKGLAQGFKRAAIQAARVTKKETP